MSHQNDYLFIKGNLNHLQYCTLLKGTLEVQGNFLFKNHFIKSSNEHKIIFSGAKKQYVDLGDTCKRCDYYLKSQIEINKENNSKITIENIRNIHDIQDESRSLENHDNIPKRYVENRLIGD